jgi:LPXTG-motif cell wall-anchored protein
MRRAVALAGSVLLSGVIPAVGALGGAAAATSAGGGQVLRVGTFDGIPGQYTSVQAAVDAAQPGDWVLIAPGDHKTAASRAPGGYPDLPAAVLITTPDLTVRGMNRDTVIIDGTKSGPPCSTATGDQNFGPMEGGSPAGLNGIMVWKATGVSVENLTACNFLGGSGGDGETGNEIWWNGGDDSGQVGGHDYSGLYLTATSTYFSGEVTAAEYGIFSSNWSGGTWDQGYASNFNDSGYYIGACQQVCDQTVDHAWAEFDALGYSGSNSGGSLVVENSQFDNNEDGFDTNSQNGDNPPPQNGGCPGDAISPITHTTSCWVFMDNYVHDNNNPDVPTAGDAAAGPVGTGMSISGGRNDTIMHNLFERNDAWGTIFVPYPDSGPPCTGGTQLQAACIYDESGDALIDNTYADNGSFDNPTNGDIAAVNLEPGPTDCFSGNTEMGGGAVSTSPPDLQLLYPTCTGAPTAPDANALFLDEVACDSEAISVGPVQGGMTCPPGASYPRVTRVIIHPLPGATASAAGLPALENPESASLPTMAACSGVPANPWCPATTTGGVAVGTGPAIAPVAAAEGQLPATGGRSSLALLGLGALGLGAGALSLRRRVRTGSRA